jgi:prevent-host-death family protein
MEVGIRDAKNSLSKLLDAVQHGEEVFLTKRGERVAKLVPTPKPLEPNRGRGMWKDKVNLYPGWDSLEEDKRIEDMFEHLNDLDSV